MAGLCLATVNDEDLYAATVVRVGHAAVSVPHREAGRRECKQHVAERGGLNRCHVARHHDRPKHGANSFRRCETYSAGVPIFLASARLRLFANRFLRRFTRAFW